MLLYALLTQDKLDFTEDLCYVKFFFCFAHPQVGRMAMYRTKLRCRNHKILLEVVEMNGLGFFQMFLLNC